MKIKLEITFEVNPDSYAAAYGDYFDKRLTPKLIEEDALHCAEQALADWFHRIGFAGCVVDPQYVKQSSFEVWNAEQSARDYDFVCNLTEECEKHLKADIDLDHYVNTALDEMWTGIRYESPDGTPHYFEIPKTNTKHGNPVVVSL